MTGAQIFDTPSAGTEAVEGQAGETGSADTQSTVIQPEDNSTFQSGETIADTAQDVDNYTDMPVSGETITETVPAAEQSSAIYDNPADTAVDNIVILLIQDMAESGTGTVSATESLANVTPAGDNVQLWMP